MEQDIADHYEKLVGVRPRVIRSSREDSRIKVDYDSHALELPKVTPTGREEKQHLLGLLDSSHSKKRSGKVAELHKLYTGKDLEEGDTRYDNVKLGNLDSHFRDTYHGGKAIDILGNIDPDQKQRIFTSLSIIMEGLSKSNRDKLKDFSFHVVGQDHPEVEKIRKAVLKCMQDKMKPEQLEKSFRNGFSLTLPKSKRIVLISPTKNVSELHKNLSHEVYHAIDDKPHIVKPFIDSPFTSYANRYEDRLAKSRESMADLFGHFSNYSIKNKNKGKNPTEKIVGFIQDTFKGKSKKDIRFKAYLIRKLHTLAGLPLPRIGIKKVLR